MPRKYTPREVALAWGTGEHRREDVVMPGFTSDQAVIEWGTSLAADHVAGWLRQLSGLDLPEGFVLADAVIGRGGRSVHYMRGERVWQVDAEALMIHNGLTEEAREILVHHIRTARGRILRTSRYREEVERFNSRVASKLTSGTRRAARTVRTMAPVLLDPTPAQVGSLSEHDAHALASYRAMFASGELAPEDGGGLLLL